MLEVGLVPDFAPSPQDPREKETAAMLFGVPGAAAHTEVSYKEYQAAYKTYSQQHPDSTLPPHGSPPPSDLRTPLQGLGGEGGIEGGVMVAWDSNSDCGSDVPQVEGGGGGGGGEGGEKGTGEASKGAKHREMVENEW